MTIRPADLGEIDAVLERLLLPFHAENGFLPLDLPKTRSWVETMLAEGRVIVALRDGEIAGGFGICEVEPRWSTTSLYHDEFYYVHPSHRGESVGADLFRAFARICETAGKKGVISVFNPGRVRRRGRNAQVFGFVPCGHDIYVA